MTKFAIRYEEKLNDDKFIFKNGSSLLFVINFFLHLQNFPRMNTVINLAWKNCLLPREVGCPMLSSFRISDAKLFLQRKHIARKNKKLHAKYYRVSLSNVRPLNTKSLGYQIFIILTSCLNFGLTVTDNGSDFFIMWTCCLRCLERTWRFWKLSPDVLRIFKVS